MKIIIKATESESGVETTAPTGLYIPHRTSQQIARNSPSFTVI